MNPVCSINHIRNGQLYLKENDPIELVCSVNFSGNWAPVMKWQQDGDPVITDGRVVNNTVPYTSVTYSFTVRATRDMNGQKFSCITYFNADNKPPTTDAANVPGYSFTCDIQELRIECELT